MNRNTILLLRIGKKFFSISHDIYDSLRLLCQEVLGVTLTFHGYFFIFIVAKKDDAPAIKPRITPTILFVPKFSVGIYDWKNSGRCGVMKIPQIKKTPVKIKIAPTMAVTYRIIIWANVSYRLDGRRRPDYESVFFSRASSQTAPA